MSLSQFFRRRSSYPLQWMVIALLILVPLGYFHWTQSRLPHREVSVTAGLRGRPGVDWFLVLHLPDITAQYESGIETMRGRFDEWLDALARAGYHPMLLSEVYARLAKDHRLPEKTVVLFFSPAYKNTLDIVGPRLGRREIPAVWLTDEHALDRLDRRFVTYETTRRLKRTGLWDVGFAGQGETFRLESADGRKIQLGGPDAPAWSPIAGAYAVNWGAVQSRVNFLTVLADWTAEDLVNRLRAETPVEDTMALVTGPIQNRSWGMSLSTSAALSPAFDLDAPLDKKAARLFWLCTRRRPDFSLQMDVTSLIGELWLRLRYDEDSGDGIFIVYTGGEIQVLQHADAQWHKLLTAPTNGRRLSLRVNLKGSELTLAANGGRLWSVHLLSTAPPPDGIVELYTADKIRGVARAKGVHLTFTPAAHPGSPL